MSKTIFLTVIFVVFVCRFTCAKIDVFQITQNNATHLTSDSFYQAAVVKARNQLVYVSYPRVNNDTSIKLEWNNKRNCEIPLPRVAYLTTQSQSLGNGKVVVALVQDPSNIKASKVDVRFYVIDFQDHCSYIQFIVNFGGTILQSYKPFAMVTYHDSFDVMAKSSLHCKPKNSHCMIRYSEDGEQLSIRNFDFDTTETTIDLESINPLVEFDSSKGYVYVSKQRSIIHILDSNLKTIKLAKTPGFLISHSVLNGDIGICSNNYDAEDNIECLKMDSRMKIKSRVFVKDPHYFDARRLYNLVDGSSLMVSLSRGGRLSGLVKRLSVDGKLGVATLFQYECQSLTTEPQDYFVELKGGVYCFSYACRDGLFTHCTSLPIVDRLPSYLT